MHVQLTEINTGKPGKDINKTACWLYNVTYLKLASISIDSLVFFSKNNTKEVLII